MAEICQGEDLMADDNFRIVLIGNAGVGKSSVGNTLLGTNPKPFATSCKAKAHTSDCIRQEGFIEQQKVTIVRGERSKNDLKSEIVSCLIECAPGPHVFILVLRVARYTQGEQKAVKTLFEWFGKDALKHTVILFTHGDDLDDEMTIDEFAKGMDSLKELFKKCGERIHVIDNKHWVPGRASGDRSNTFQVGKLMKTITNIVTGAGIYTNASLAKLGEAIKAEVENIKIELEQREESLDISEIRKQARERVKTKTLKLVAGVTTGVLIGALLGVSVGALLPAILVAGLFVGTAKTVMQIRPRGGGQCTEVGKMAGIVTAQIGSGVAGGVIAGLETGAVAAAGIGLGVASGVAAVGCIVACGITGAKAAKRSNNPDEAAKEAAQSVVKETRDAVKKTWEFTQEILTKESSYKPMNE